jgi:hypothetical protein
MAAKREVVVTYDAKTKTWNAENPVNVYPGVTNIVWTIELTDKADGDISFGVQPDFPGIFFEGAWPGTPPSGDEKAWSTDIADTLQPDDPPQTFAYTVNAWYRSTDRQLPPSQVSWDPDVEENTDPPPA